MRRAAGTVAATVVGLWLVLTFKSSPLPRSAATTASGPVGPRTATTITTIASTTTTAATRTVDGDVVRTRYGDVQVEVVVSGSRILDVKALELPFDRPRSQSISDQVAPWLHDEVLRAQSAQIDTIGGATYTSDGYAQSLQSALDRARG